MLLVFLEAESDKFDFAKGLFLAIRLVRISLDALEWRQIIAVLTSLLIVFLFLLVQLGAIAIVDRKTVRNIVKAFLRICHEQLNFRFL